MTKLFHLLIRLLTFALAGYCLIAIVYLAWPTSAWIAVIVAFLKWRFRRMPRPTDLGSARWADEKDLRDAGMLGGPRGLILGRQLTKTGLFRSSRRAPLVRVPQAIHTVIVGPTGTGKGVSFVIPTLLTNPESAVVLDFKGELARATAEHRRKHFGHRVVLLDPYHVVTGTPDALNPLDSIAKGDPLAIDDCSDLAAAVVVRTGQERERHWDDSAEACIAAVAATVVAYGEPHTRSLQNVREILSHPRSFELAIRLMIESQEWNGALSHLGGQLTHFADKEKASVLSSTLRQLRFLGTPAIAACTAKSSFDPAELRRGRMTIFCIVPPERARAQTGLLRLWISSMLRACVRGGLQ